jgi:hypothetical protein
LRAPLLKIFRSSRQALIIDRGDDARMAEAIFVKRSMPYSAPWMSRASESPSV